MGTGLAWWCAFVIRTGVSDYDMLLQYSSKAFASHLDTSSVLARVMPEGVGLVISFFGGWSVRRSTEF